MKTLFVAPLLFLIACANSPTKKPSSPAPESACSLELANLKSQDPLIQLKLLSSLYDHKCFAEVVTLGTSIRQHSRDKFYNIFAETMEFFLPAGSTTEYILESYERSYLSFLLSASYEHLGRHEDSAVEIRRAYDEGKAEIYNYGEDLVNVVLQAVLWENSNEPQNARPFWLRVQQNSNDKALQDFAKLRIQALDQHQQHSQSWKIYSYGKFPKLDWKVNFESQASNGGRLAGDLCQTSIEAGKMVFDKSGAITNYILEPDLRNWQQVPEGFFIVDQDTSPTDS